MKSSEIIKFIRNIYKDFYPGDIPLHEPLFLGNEKNYIKECIDSTFVSSVGEFVNKFENVIEKFTDTRKAILTTNGTSALHAALFYLGVKNNDFVITQSLTFVAPCNAISYLGAEPIFVDVEKKSLGMCPKSLKSYLDRNAIFNNDNECIHAKTGRKISCIVPVHIYGHACKIDEIIAVANQWNIKVIEDSSECLGSFYKGKHLGSYGDLGVLSFNGNKILTTGGGGAIITNSENDGKKLKHITTTSKKSHKYKFIHEEIGFNYRLPNINSALGFAQMKSIDIRIKEKRNLAKKYKQFFQNSNYSFVDEPTHSKSNFWLNTILTENIKERDYLLELGWKNNVSLRPTWECMHTLPMFSECIHSDLSNTKYLQDRIVNLPSTPIIK